VTAIILPAMQRTDIDREAVSQLGRGLALALAGGSSPDGANWSARAIGSTRDLGVSTLRNPVASASVKSVPAEDTTRAALKGSVACLTRRLNPNQAHRGLDARRAGVT